MRIAKDQTQYLADAPTARFLLVVDAMQGDVRVEKDGNLLVRLALDEKGCVHAHCHFPDGKQFTLQGEGAALKEVILTAGYARMGLYVNGVLEDENFFFAPMDYLGAMVYAGSYMHFEAGYEYHSMAESAIVEHVAESFDGFAPHGREMAVKDVRLAVLYDRLHVFYLDERQKGRVKEGMGANRLCALFLAEDGTVASAPIALPIDSIEEKRVVDAAPLCLDGRVYLYYLVDYRGGRALSCAVSEDGFSFIKTGLDVEIPGGNAREMEHISVWCFGGETVLSFTTKERTYLAKSIDLLHFEAPVPLSFADGFSRFYGICGGDAPLFFSEKEGVLYQSDCMDAAAWRPVTHALPSSHAVLWKNKLAFAAVKDGKIVFSYEE